MWFVRLNKKAKKQLEKLDKPTQLRIVTFLESKIAPADDPRILGKSLKGKIFGDFVRFRVGNYRLICDVQDSKITVLVLRIAHRREVYNG